jgi:hypothetical protein
MDKFAEYPTTLIAPARDAIDVSPNDSTDLSILPRAIYVGQAGHVSARLAGGQTVVFQNAQAGSFLPIRAAGINATGTTAANLIALW